MIDTAKETICKYCGAPIVTIPGHRPREYCNATHRQLAFRARRAREEVTNVTLVNDSHQRIAELEQELSEKDGRIEELEQVVHDLQARLDLEERYRLDTVSRSFKSWLKKQRPAQDVDFAKRFLADTRLPHQGSPSFYERALHLYHYSSEDIHSFREAWKTMLLQS